MQLTLSRELAVFNTVWLIGFLAFAAVEIFLIRRVVTCKPLHGAIALEGENVCGYAIKKSAIMRDNHRATGKVLQAFLQRSNRIYVEIIGWFVKEDKVGATLE